MTGVQTFALPISFTAIDKLSLEIKEGEITGLLGPNGAGKTTTMRMITGYFPPCEGEVFVDGYEVSKEPEKVKSILGYLPENPPLYGEMITLDYLRYIAAVRAIPGEEVIIKTAETCGIWEVLHKRIDQLSKGYKQRVGLAQAILHDPKILILDEPTAGLDPNQIAEVRDLIREIGKTKTVILSTHILQEVEAVADRVVIINQGRIVEDNSTGNLQSVRRGRYWIRMIISGEGAEESAGLFKEIPGVVEAKVVPGEEYLTTLQILSSAESDVRPLLFRTVRDRNWTLYEMSREKHSLESVFRELTTGGSNEQHS